MGSIRFALFRFVFPGKRTVLLGINPVYFCLNVIPECCWRNHYVITFFPYRFGNMIHSVPCILQSYARTDEGNVLKSVNQLFRQFF